MSRGGGMGLGGRRGFLGKGRRMGERMIWEFGLEWGEKHVSNCKSVVSLRKAHLAHGWFLVFLSVVDVWILAGSCASSSSSLVSFSCVDGRAKSVGFGRRFFEGLSRMSSGESVCFRLTGSWGTLLAIMERQTATLKPGNSWMMRSKSFEKNKCKQTKNFFEKYGRIYINELY